MSVLAMEQERLAEIVREYKRHGSLLAALHAAGFASVFDVKSEDMDEILERAEEDE